MIGKYLVIVYPPAARQREATDIMRMGGTVASTTLASPPRVATVEARFPADAAEKANVQPGGYCVVVTDAHRFDRAEQAPLEPKQLDGNPLPEPADVA